MCFSSKAMTVLLDIVFENILALIAARWKNEKKLCELNITSYQRLFSTKKLTYPMNIMWFVTNYQVDKNEKKKCIKNVS